MLLFILALWLPVQCDLKVTSSPVLFKHCGEIEISGRDYHTVLEVSVKQLIWDISPIKTMIDDISLGLSRAIKRLDQRMGDGHTFHNGTDDIPFQDMSTAMNSQMRLHVNFLLKDLNEKKLILTEFLESIGKPKPSRAKRGMIDGGGQILKWLFGVATDRDLDSTQDLLDEVNKITEATRVEVNLHSQILNSTAMNFEKIDDHIYKLTACLKNVQDGIHSLSGVVENNREHAHSIIHAVIMTNNLAYASSAISDLSSEFINLKLGLDKFTTGYLSSDIIPPATILDLMQHITAKNLKPIYPATAEYLPILYRVIRVEALPFKPLTFVISIPLTGDPPIKFDMYEIFNMPHPINAQITMTYSNLPKYLAVSDDRRLYQEFETMEGCRVHDTYYLCRTDLPIYRDDAPSCALDLFRGNSDRSCNKHFGGPLTRPQLIKTDIGWLYSFSAPTNLSITCPYNTSIIQVPRGSGKLELGVSCKISDHKFLIPSEASPSGTQINFNAALVAPFKIGLSEDELEKFELVKDSEILKNIMLLNNNHLPLKSL